MSVPLDLTGKHPTWPAGTSEVWRLCLTEATRDERYWATPPYQGLPALRETLAGRIGRRAAEITVTTGVRAAALTAVGAASVVRVEVPSFSGVSAVLQAAGRTVHTAAWPQVWRDAAPGEAVWVTSPGRNPDGASLTADDRRELTEAAVRGVRVIVNETNRWMCDPCLAPEGAVAVGTLAKVLGMGLRVGYAVLPDSPGDAERAMCPPTGWQLALHELFRRGGFDHVLASVWPARQAANEVRRRAAWHGLCAPDGQGLSLLLALPKGMTEDGGVRLAARCGLVVSCGRYFDARWPSIRLTTSSLDTNAGDELARRADQLLSLLAEARDRTDLGRSE